jgi:hypothetical protein
MAGISTYLANALLDHLLGGDAYEPPTALYLALYTTNPTAGDTGTEVSGDGYARQAVTFEEAAAAATENDAAVVFPAAEEAWGTITHWGIRDADTEGNLLLFGPVQQSRDVYAGDTVKVNVGALDVALA